VAGIEAMVLAGHARERWPAGEVEALRARVDREAPRLREIGPDPSALARIRRPCPMLDERLGLCRAYEARPVNCRRENSIDVEVCRRYREDPESNESSIRLVRYDVIWGAARVFLSRWSADLLDSDLDETMPMELALSLALAREPAPEAPNRAEAPREADRPDEP
jgi:hypothetical protein